MCPAYKDKMVKSDPGTSPNDAPNREMYINADMESKAADSVMISAAKRGCFEAPGMRDTRRIRVTMIMVEKDVVVTDNAIQEICTALLICGGIQTGHMAITKCARPAAECNVRLEGFT
jgi:hypothetical protein